MTKEEVKKLKSGDVIYTVDVCWENDRIYLTEATIDDVWPDCVSISLERGNSFYPKSGCGISNELLENWAFSKSDAYWLFRNALIRMARRHYKIADKSDRKAKYYRRKGE